MLVDVYNKLKKDGCDIEIVFLSSDNSPREFDEYFKSMPWKSIKFGDDRAQEVIYITIQYLVGG
jgi:uncharacterized membrane protein